MSSLVKYSAGLAAFLAFALLNPLYLLGCGPMCGGGGFDYSEEDVMTNLEPYAGAEHVYTVSNSDGTLILSMKIEEDSFQTYPQATMSSFDASAHGLLNQAMACSYDEDEDIMVGGVFSATFDFNDGETRELFADKEFLGVYRLRGWGDDPSSATLTVELPYEVEFALRSSTGGPDGLKVRHFEAEDFAAADIRPYQ